MQVQLKPWGNSQGIRLPKEIIQVAGIKLHDSFEIKASKGKIVLIKPFHHKTLEERAVAFGDKLQLDGEFRLDEPVGREVW